MQSSPILNNRGKVSQFLAGLEGHIWGSNWARNYFPIHIGGRNLGAHFKFRVHLYVHLGQSYLLPQELSPPHHTWNKRKTLNNPKM